MARDVYLVLLEFGQEHEHAALALLLPTLHRVCPGAIVRSAIVDNALDGDGEIAMGHDRHRLSGDNTLREFSGWDRGLAWLERRYAPSLDAIVVLANDTIVRPDKDHRVRNLSSDRAAAASEGALVGYVEAYPRPVTLFGHSLRQFVDTSFVLATLRTLGALRPFARPQDDEALFTDDWRHVFREPSPLSENYRAYLTTWLSGESTAGEFQQTWHAKAPLTESTVETFKAKVRCYLCEHLLSATARLHGIPLVDIRPTPLPIDPV